MDSSGGHGYKVKRMIMGNKQVKKIEKGTPYERSDEEDKNKLKAGDDETIFEMPLAPRKIEDKTGWTVREENKAVFGSKGK